LSRNAALRGQDVVLSAIFLDAAGNPTDPSNLKLHIFPPGVDPIQNPDFDQAWVYNITLTDPGQGPYADMSETIEKVDAGKYQYTFTVPTDAELGAAFDWWQGTVDSQDLSEAFTFTIVGGGSIGTTLLYENNMVFVELSKEIKDIDGNSLGSDYSFYFTTTYNPLYSSVRRVRLDLGPLISEVPDDTINLALFEASLEADALTFGFPSTNSGFFNFARRQYVTCRAEQIILNAIMGNFAATGTGGKRKALADLTVAYTGGSGDIEDLLKRAIACSQRWEVTLTSAGEISPNTSQKPSMVIKGRLDPDRPHIGRNWEPTNPFNSYESQFPAANVKSRRYGYRRWRHDYAISRWGSRFDREID